MKKQSRMGKHKEGKFSLGIYVDDDFRALLALLVDMTGLTATDIIMDGVFAHATRLHVMENNEVLPEYQVAIQLLKEEIAHKRESRKSSKKGSK